MLRNPTYQGTACFGKTRRARRQRVTRPLRLRGGAASRDSANHERPREEWMEIPVPAIVDESTFARAQELLHENKVHARRRTVDRASCRGWSVARNAATRSRARRAGRAPGPQVAPASCCTRTRCTPGGARSTEPRAGAGQLPEMRLRALARVGPVERPENSLLPLYRIGRMAACRGFRCDTRPVRQGLLDEVVWAEVIPLLESALIQEELDRRLAAARGGRDICARRGIRAVSLFRGHRRTGRRIPLRALDPIP